MLKGIPDILSPDLLKFLMEMGHGDELVIADGNFPGAALARHHVRCDGHQVAEVLAAILTLMPLDFVDEKPVTLMHSTMGTPDPPSWDTYRAILNRYEPDHCGIGTIERYAFYERAKQAYVIISTSDRHMRGNIILKKGVC